MNGQDQQYTRQNISQHRTSLMMNKRQWKKQQGMTGIAMALVLGLIAFFVLIALKLFPIYMEHFSVTSHLEQLANDAGAKNKTNAEIMDTLHKRFRVDNVKSVKDENIFIERSGGGTTIVAIEYEVRTATIGNVDMVVSFVDEVELN